MTNTELEVTDRWFRTTVYLIRKPFSTLPDAHVIEHLGPADIKLDDKYNLHVEYYPRNSDFEVTALFVVADTFYAVTQEEIIAEDEETDEDCPCEDCGDGELPNATEEGTP